MSSAKITLYGAYKWFADQKTLGGTDNLFDYFVLPSGVDVETVKNNILLRGGEFEVLYANPDFMRAMIATWSAKWKHTFERWVKALSVDYEPLENYDRMEFETRTPNITHNKKASVHGTRTPDLTTQRNGSSTDTNGGSVTEEKEVSAYDSSSYQPAEKTTTNPENTLHTVANDTVRETGTETEQENQTETDEETGNETWNRRAHGNIGVTTSQQMLESELEVAKWNLVDHITDVFLREFVIPVYE